MLAAEHGSFDCTFSMLQIPQDTPMLSPRLPPEILNHTVDLVHDEPKMLKECCVGSRPRASGTRINPFSPKDVES